MNIADAVNHDFNLMFGDLCLYETISRVDAACVEVIATLLVDGACYVGVAVIGTEDTKRFARDRHGAAALAVRIKDKVRRAAFGRYAENIEKHVVALAPILC